MKISAKNSLRKDMRVNTFHLRVIIGLLGVLLPWIVSILSTPFTNCWPDSISTTWHTNACTPFMIILGSAGLLLICYKGYEWFDDVILTLSGIAALVICLFPCKDAYAIQAEIYDPNKNIGTFMIKSSISDKIHVTAAVIFFILLAYNSFFLFTKSSGEKTKQKNIRNIIYIVCGLGMGASSVLLLFKNLPCKMWWIEVIALTLFGVSFLTKAGWFFPDRPQQETEDAQNVHLHVTVNVELQHPEQCVTDIS